MGEFEEAILKEFRGRETPVIVVFNKADLGRPNKDLLHRLKTGNIPVVHTTAPRGEPGRARHASMACAP